MKTCTKCGIEKRLKAFYRKNRAHCIDCERIDARMRMANVENKARNAYRTAKKAAKKFGSYDDLTQDDVIYLFKLADGRCAFTGKFSVNLSLDHLVPLSKGGRNSIDNVIVVDLALNISKRDNSTLEYILMRREPQRAFEIVKLVAARSQRSYAEVFDDLHAHQIEENNAWYRKHIQPFIEREGA